MQDYVTKTEFKTSMDDIGQNFRTVFDKFDEVDTKLEQIDRRFDQLEASIDQRFAYVDLRFNRLDHNIAVIIRHLGIPADQVAI